MDGAKASQVAGARSHTRTHAHTHKCTHAHTHTRTRSLSSGPCLAPTPHPSLSLARIPLCATCAPPPTAAGMRACGLVTPWQQCACVWSARGTRPLPPGCPQPHGRCCRPTSGWHAATAAPRPSSWAPVLARAEASHVAPVMRHSRSALQGRGSRKCGWRRARSAVAVALVRGTLRARK
jgi:hypothetical protein